MNLIHFQHNMDKKPSPYFIGTDFNTDILDSRTQTTWISCRNLLYIQPHEYADIIKAIIDMKTYPERLSKHYNNKNCTMDVIRMRARVHMIRLNFIQAKHVSRFLKETRKD